MKLMQAAGVTFWVCLILAFLNSFLGIAFASVSRDGAALLLISAFVWLLAAFTRRK